MPRAPPVRPSPPSSQRSTLSDADTRTSDGEKFERPRQGRFGRGCSLTDAGGGRRKGITRDTPTPTVARTRIHFQTRLSFVYYKEGTASTKEEFLQCFPRKVSLSPTLITHRSDGRRNPPRSCKTLGPRRRRFLRGPVRDFAPPGRRPSGSGEWTNYVRRRPSRIPVTVPGTKEKNRRSCGIRHKKEGGTSRDRPKRRSDTREVGTKGSRDRTRGKSLV